MSKTWMFPIKGMGGSRDVLQLISKLGFRPQPEPSPIPNGYGTVRFPHFCGHPGFVMVVVVVVLVVGVWAKERETSGRKTAAKLIGCMIIVDE